MAATHWLDISLTLDSITWHFGNFGEPHLVVETEAGLCGGSVCSDRFFGLLSGKIVQLVVVVAVGM